MLNYSLKMELLQWWQELTQNEKNCIIEKNNLDPILLQSEELIINSFQTITSLNINAAFGKDFSIVKVFSNLEYVITDFNNNLESFNGIQYLKKLKELNLYDTHLDQIGSEIKDLTNLGIIYLPKTIRNIENLSFVNSLTEIIFHQETKDISLTPIKSLTKLRKVILPDSTSDITPILGLRSLELVSCFNMKSNDHQVKVLLKFNPKCEFRGIEWKKKVDTIFDDLMINNNSSNN